MSHWSPHPWVQRWLDRQRLKQIAQTELRRECNLFLKLGYQPVVPWLNPINWGVMKVCELQQRGTRRHIQAHTQSRSAYYHLPLRQQGDWMSVFATHLVHVTPNPKHAHQLDPRIKAELTWSYGAGLSAVDASHFWADCHWWEFEVLAHAAIRSVNPREEYVIAVYQNRQCWAQALQRYWLMLRNLSL